MNHVIELVTRNHVDTITAVRKLGILLVALLDDLEQKVAALEQKVAALEKKIQKE